MLTAKENLLRTIHRDGPEWVPTAEEGLAWIGPPVVERCTAAGRDDFGVHWSYEVRAEVRRRIDEMAAGGGYIAAPSHSVPSDPALIDAMNDEIASYGRRCYARSV